MMASSPVRAEDKVQISALTQEPVQAQKATMLKENGRLDADFVVNPRGKEGGETIVFGSTQQSRPQKEVGSLNPTKSAAGHESEVPKQNNIIKSLADKIDLDEFPSETPNPPLLVALIFGPAILFLIVRFPGFPPSDVSFVPYKDETDIPGIVELIGQDLSEPYPILTYRYFINQWPELCFQAQRKGSCVGAIVCKLDTDRYRKTSRGYIAMLAVEKDLRGQKIGSTLVRLCLDKMKEVGADECTLETEVTNKGALALYRSLGFVNEKRLQKYYDNGNDAFRLKFIFK